jgi:hypothetical protein
MEKSRAPLDFTFPHATDIQIDDVTATAEAHLSRHDRFEDKMRSCLGVTERYSDALCIYRLDRRHNRSQR